MRLEKFDVVRDGSRSPWGSIISPQAIKGERRAEGKNLAPGLQLRAEIHDLGKPADPRSLVTHLKGCLIINS